MDQKRSQAAKKTYKDGRVPYWKGKNHSEATRLKIGRTKKLQHVTAWNKGTKGIMVAWNKGMECVWISKRNHVANRLRKGEKHWNWKGGIGKERHRLMGQIEYKKWRSSVFQRDAWTCQMCQAKGGYLEAHHIKSWSKFPDLRYEVSNGKTLCLPCHNLLKGR